MLEACQEEALNQVANYALRRKPKAQESLRHILEMSDISLDDFSDALNTLISQARVALHFHPDRLCFSGESVVESLLAGGLYKSQFETRISAGSVSARPGGQRFEWENELFAQAYLRAPAEQRPKYGALHVMQSPDGPAPRFGSCYLVLKPQVSQRCSYTYLDSHLNPPHRGTLKQFDDVLAALFTESFERNYALGWAGTSPQKLLESFLQLGTEQGRSAPSRNLDHYIEAQVHGLVSIRDDAERLVGDPAFQGTEIGEQLEQLAATYELKLRWHQGFRLEVSAVPKDFRGPVMPSLAARVAGEKEWIDARLIGEACRSLAASPESWKEFGEAEQVLQLLKRLWHVVLKFGGRA